MRVIRADALGLCFGVRDALRALERISDPQDVTVHGELVHNPQVLVQLQARGFRQTPEDERSAMPATSSVLVTAHGISDRERARLQGAGKQLIDTTCPLVRRVHEAAQRLQQSGYHVLIIGRRHHVEVQGIVEDLTQYDIVQSADDVRTFAAERLGVVCQSTTPSRTFDELCRAIIDRNPQAEVRCLDTVCQPTKDRQSALERLLPRVEAMVVVGGRQSHNTRQLVALCTSRGCRTVHVESAAELDSAWFAGCTTVGLTAGTSTLDHTIEEVHVSLLRIATGGVPCLESR